jgi:hypothetical protein
MRIGKSSARKSPPHPLRGHPPSTLRHIDVLVGGWRISSRACAGGCSVRRKVPSTGNIPVHVCTSATGRVCTAWPRKGHDIMSCCPLVAEHFETECVFLCPQTWTTKRATRIRLAYFIPQSTPDDGGAVHTSDVSGLESGISQTSMRFVDLSQCALTDQRRGWNCAVTVPHNFETA